MTDELSGNSQLPGVIVALKLIAPRRQRPQGGLSPRGGANVHDGRVSASQDGGEIDDSPPKALREPRCILVAPVVHPLRLGPFISRSGKYDRLAGAVEKFARHARRCGVRVVVPS